MSERLENTKVLSSPSPVRGALGGLREKSEEQKPRQETVWLRFFKGAFNTVFFNVSILEGSSNVQTLYTCLIEKKS